MSARIVFAALVVFVLAWGTLLGLALRASDQEATEPEASPRRLSADEIARHDSPDDCWLVIRGRVYDVTEYIDSHPAPRRTITDHCGEESTWAFETKERDRPHSPHAWELLDRYVIGDASSAEASDHSP